MNTRPAVEADLPRVLDIYNHAIRTGTAVYEDKPHTLEMRQDWFAAKKTAGMPVLVIEDEEGVAGFGTYGPFRSQTGFCFSVEHSVYIAQEKRRLGYGGLLLSALIEAATKQGMHLMIATIDAQNESSIRLHLAFGFAQVGQMKEVGRKFDRWLDIVFLQKTLPSFPS